jgi:hypothetical protein
VNIPGCTYCVEGQGTTRDDVPPKGLFPEPLPSDLVTVPCCEACRSAQSADDEYFRTMLAMRHDAAQHPAAAEVLQRVHRALARPEQRRFTGALLASTKDVAIRSLAGLYVGTGTTYSVNLKRLDSVIARSMRGLHYHLTGQRVLPGQDVTVFCLEGFPNASLEVQSQLERLADHALSGERRAFAGDAFVYWHQPFGSWEVGSLWAFLDYRAVSFVGYVWPRAG